MCLSMMKMLYFKTISETSFLLLEWLSRAREGTCPSLVWIVLDHESEALT